MPPDETENDFDEVYQKLSRLDCPKCHSKMREGTVRGVIIDRCPECVGIWFDRKELPEILERGGGKYLRELSRGATGTRPRPKSSWKRVWFDELRGRCPRCDEALAQKPVDGLEDFRVDICRICGGVWYDGGELHKYLDHIERITGKMRRVIRGIFRRGKRR